MFSEFPPKSAFIRNLCAVSLALTLAGCLQSAEPLLDESTGQTPLDAGRYAVEQITQDGSAYERIDMLTLDLEDNIYTGTEDQEGDPVSFTLHPIGVDTYAGMASSDEGSGYAVMRIGAEYIEGWAATCEVAGKLGLVERFELADDGLTCTLADADTLGAVLNAFLTTPADYRYRRVVE